MNTFFETENFYVDIQEKPFVSREEGGHVRIMVKDKSITDRTKLSPKQAIEFMRLSMVVGEAFSTVMNTRGVPVVKVNYQDMGNWAYKQGKTPSLHYHIFGRVLGAQKQPYPESVYLPDRGTGFYEGFEPLALEDTECIRQEMEKLFAEQRFQDREWGLGL